MQVHCDRCPNCSSSLYFPAQYRGDYFRIICPHCHVGYDLLEAEVSEDVLSNLLNSYSQATFIHKPGIYKKLFQFLSSVAAQFRFACPSNPNAIIFLASKTRSVFPLAVYFQNNYYQVRSFNRIQFSVSLATLGALVLLGHGLSLVPILIGTLLAILCFLRLTGLPKIKGETRTRLEAEQSLLKQCFELGQSLERVSQIRRTYNNYLLRQQSVLEQMALTPAQYPTQIELYQRTIKCTQDYLKLCDRIISQYEAAIRSVVIQLETSKLSVDLSFNFPDTQMQHELARLEDQLASTIPPNPSQYDSNDFPAT